MKRAIILACFAAALVAAAGLPSPRSSAPRSPRQATRLTRCYSSATASRPPPRKVLPAVVAVEAIKPAKASVDGKGKPIEESGSGVIVRVDGKSGYYVLTNNHVIAQARPEQITISVPDGRVYHPVQVWADPESDIAVMSVNAPSLPTATLGNSDQVRVGRWVLAIGSPFGLNQTVTHGIISARDRGQVSLGGTIRIKEFLQTDAAINPGSSGGPLLDMHGEVIGINTAIASHNGSNSGVAFSIPINLVKRVAGQLVANGAVQRGYLGMQLAATFDGEGALKLGLDRLRGALIEQHLRRVARRRRRPASSRRDPASGERANPQRHAPDQPRQQPAARPARPVDGVAR